MHPSALPAYWIISVRMCVSPCTWFSCIDLSRDSKALYFTSLAQRALHSLFKSIRQPWMHDVHIWVLKVCASVCYHRSSRGTLRTAGCPVKEESRRVGSTWTHRMSCWAEEKRREWVNMNAGRSQRVFCSQKLKIACRSRTFEPYGKELKDILWQNALTPCGSETLQIQWVIFSSCNVIKLMSYKWRLSKMSEG